MKRMSQRFEEAIRRNPKPKYFQITEDRLWSFAKLQPKQQELLLAMIKRLKLTHMPESYIGEATYKDFGYTGRQQYHRDKKALVDAGFIETKNKQYFVRLDAIMYTSQRAYRSLLHTFGIWDDFLGGFGKRSFVEDKMPIPPPPK